MFSYPWPTQIVTTLILALIKPLNNDIDWFIFPFCLPKGYIILVKSSRRFSGALWIRDTNMRSANGHWSVAYHVHICNIEKCETKSNAESGRFYPLYPIPPSRFYCHSQSRLEVASCFPHSEFNLNLNYLCRIRRRFGRKIILNKNSFLLVEFLGLPKGMKAFT